MKISFKIGIVLLLIISLGIGGFFIWYNMESNKENIYNEKYSTTLNKNRYNYIKDDYNKVFDIVNMIKTRDYTKGEIKKLAWKMFDRKKPIMLGYNPDASSIRHALYKLNYNFYLMTSETTIEDSLGIEHIFLNGINKEYMEELSKYLDEWVIYDLQLSTEDYKYLYDTCMVEN